MTPLTTDLDHCPNSWDGEHVFIIGLNYKECVWCGLKRPLHPPSEDENDNGKEE